MRQELPFDPNKLSIVFLGQIATGLAEDNYCEIELNEEATFLYVGADGEHSRAINRNMSGTAKLRIRSTSPFNDILSAAYQLDKRTGEGAGEFELRDANGTTVASCAQAWVSKVPPASFGKKVTEREWVITLGRLELNIGGNYRDI